MALSKSIETNAGASATYWRIVNVAFDVRARTVWYVLAGYVNQAANLANKAPLREQPFTMILGVGQTPESIGRPDLYADAKVQIAEGREAPEFGDAVDA